MAELIKAPWSDWETVRLIGRGSFGTVYEIQRKLVDGETEAAALKVITIPQNPSDIDELYSEGYDEESITATFNAHLKSIIADAVLPLGSFISFDGITRDSGAENVYYSHLRYEKLGLRIKFVLFENRINGLWLSYYEL